jgi:hypothetical protein
MRDLTSHEPIPYDVSDRDGRFDVRSASGRVVMSCGDEASARHYASLLNEAFDAGYKAGFRDGRAG